MVLCRNAGASAGHAVAAARRRGREACVRAARARAARGAAAQSADRTRAARRVRGAVAAAHHPAEARTAFCVLLGSTAHPLSTVHSHNRNSCSARDLQYGAYELRVCSSFIHYKYCTGGGGGHVCARGGGSRGALRRARARARRTRRDARRAVRDAAGAGGRAPLHQLSRPRARRPVRCVALRQATSVPFYPTSTSLLISFCSLQFFSILCIVF